MWTVNFSLDGPSPLEADSEIDGMSVEVKENNGTVIVRFVQAADAQEARSKAFATANQFLSALSWKFATHLAIEGESLNIEHIDPSGKRQVFLSVSERLIVHEKAAVVQKDASGDTIGVSDSVKRGKIDVKHSEAAHFYRQAHLTSHPFDKFANLYRVAENIGDKIRIIKGHSRGSLERIYGRKSYEMNVLQLALDECFKANL